MTGTAQTEAAELHQIYKLGVVPIPTNRPMVRADQADLIYKTEEAKFDAVVDDIAERHEKGQPVLVGTTSVEKLRVPVASCSPQRRRPARGAQRQVPRAGGGDHRRRPGGRGAVTVATNMAGRGTDIVLGGNVDFLADLRAARAGPGPGRDARGVRGGLARGASRRSRRRPPTEAEEVRDAGGLYVLGTERHESRRIDNQLRGRSGRQGDPGESRFYLSLGDDLMRRFGGAHRRVADDPAATCPTTCRSRPSMVTQAIKSAQTQVEQQNFEIRKNVLKYDEVMNKQRTVIYDERRRVLDGEDLHRAGRRT